MWIRRRLKPEKQEAKWTYHHLQGYMPLMGYVNGMCVGHEFREGNQSPGGGDFGVWAKL